MSTTSTIQSAQVIYINNCCLHGANCPKNNNNNKTQSYNTNINNIQTIHNELLNSLNYIESNYITPEQYVNQAIQYLNEERKHNNNNNDDSKYDTESKNNNEYSNEYITVYNNNDNIELTDQGINAVEHIFNVFDTRRQGYITLKQLEIGMTEVLGYSFNDDGLLIQHITVIYKCLQ